VRIQGRELHVMLPGPFLSAAILCIAGCAADEGASGRPIEPRLATVKWIDPPESVTIRQNHETAFSANVEVRSSPSRRLKVVQRIRIGRRWRKSSVIVLEPGDASGRITTRWFVVVRTRRIRFRYQLKVFAHGRGHPILKLVEDRVYRSL
jgi:hypothetical protein